MRTRPRRAWRLPIAALAFLSIAALHAAGAEPVRVEVCVYGGTSAGVAAAVRVAMQGRSVLLVEPGRHLGGMSSGGLGHTDFGNKRAIGGLSRQFYQRLGKFYNQEEAWQFQPRHAEQVFREWTDKHKVRTLFEHRLAGLEKSGPRITRITLENAPPLATGAPSPGAIDGRQLVVEAILYIDASYEGDLLARAKVSYTVGREAVAKYGEPLNGIRAKTPLHQFLVPVDPYLRPGDPASGLLPLIQEGDGGTPGEGDHRLQAYNFRLCLTKDPNNKLPLAAPRGYDPARYELLGRYLEKLVAAGRKPALSSLLAISLMPGGKTDINNNGAVSTDFIGANYDYPDGDYATRSRIWEAHLHYVQGLLHYLATSERVPVNVRAEMSAWGPCRDEFADTGHWPHQMYVREARRMIGRYVVTQHDCEHRTQIDDSVGMGAYNMDSHNCQRIVKNSAVENEGDVQVGPKGPYPVPYRAITPRTEECVNLLVPVCLSATHIAYGSIRMEPVFMVLGESAAFAACQAIEEGMSVQEIDYPRLRRALLEAGQVLEFTPS